MKTYKIRLFSKNAKLTLEAPIDAETLTEAMTKAKALMNDVNATNHFSADFVLKAVTIHEQ